MITPPKATKAPTIERKSIMDWSAGTVTDYDARRLVDNALQRSVNISLEQNGVVRPRPSLIEYGPQPVGEILGELFECKVIGADAKPTFYLIAMMLVNGVANLYYARGEDTSWTKISGHNYNTSADAHFLMCDGKVLVMNGEDGLSYINPSNWSITVFSQINSPAKPTLTATGLSGSDYHIYYAVTANSSVGETAGSEVASITVGKARDMWDSDSNSVKITWSAVTGAKSYNVYVGVTSDGVGNPSLYLLQSNIDPSDTSFVDNGTLGYSIARPLPEYNSTAGPKTKRGTVVNGRVWMVGDKENPYYVRWGGDYGYELDFSPSNGGGFTTVANGTKEVPISVMPFRKGQGDSTVVVLTQGSNGSGKRYHLSSTTISYGSQSVVAWSPTEDSGTDGTDSPDGVVIYNNSLYYPSRDGFKTTGTQPSLQNVLSTTRISNTIRDQVSLLNTSAMNKAVGLAYEGSIYWALPVGADHNNRIFVFDLEHKGSWLVSWYIDADWLMLYNDNSGNTHFLLVSEGKIYELSRRMLSYDGDKAFKSELQSGQIAWSKDQRDWARLIQVVFTLLKPSGTINLLVNGLSEDGEMEFSRQIKVSNSVGGIGWSEPDAHWSGLRAWSEVKASDKDTDANDSIDVIIEVDEDVQWFSYQLSTDEKGADYKLSSVVAEYVSIGIKDLS